MGVKSLTLHATSLGSIPGTMMRSQLLPKAKFQALRPHTTLSTAGCDQKHTPTLTPKKENKRKETEFVLHLALL